jgi:NAD(P)-dependent dehydrogenase (short-subunit alcohol dehydrogenase family)
MGSEPTTQRTAVVTGGAKGIGRAVSEHLASSGWNLVLCGRDRAALDEVGARIRSRYRVAVDGVAIDLSQTDAVGALFSRWGRPEVLPLAMVCGAADYGVMGPLEGVDFLAWKRSFDLNFFSVAEMIQRYVRIALCGAPVPRRSIVVMAGAGLGAPQVAGSVSAYSCAKAALNRLVEVVHEEVHARGIDINCVLPGLVNTGMVDQAVAAGPGLGALYEASLKARGGGGTPPEVAAEMIAHLLSDACSGVSGRLLSAKWDRRALASPAPVAGDPHLFRLRRIDNDLFGKLK